MDKWKKGNRWKVVSESIGNMKERRDGGSHDSIRNREVRNNERRWRMENTGKKGSVKGVVGGNCEENRVCRKGGER